MFLRILFAMTAAMLSAAVGTGQEPPPASAPNAECPLCKLPNRAALLAGLAQKCPDDCAKLCCTGEEATYLVEGLVCQNCSASLTAALAKLDAVHVVAVCHNTGQARLKYDPKRASERGIVAAIVAAGHQVTGRKFSFAVAGLTTKEQAQALRERLSRIPGVRAIDASPGESGQLVAIYDPALSEPADFEKAIAEAGYRLGPVE